MVLYNRETRMVTVRRHIPTERTGLPSATSPPMSPSQVIIPGVRVFNISLRIPPIESWYATSWEPAANVPSAIDRFPDKTLTT